MLCLKVCWCNLFGVSRFIVLFVLLVLSGLCWNGGWIVLVYGCVIIIRLRIIVVCGFGFIVKVFWGMIVVRYCVGFCMGCLDECLYVFQWMFVYVGVGVLFVIVGDGGCGLCLCYGDSDLCLICFIKFSVRFCLRMVVLFLIYVYYLQNLVWLVVFFFCVVYQMLLILCKRCGNQVMM